MKKSTYTITELAKEFDVTTRAIRFYEDQGLLCPRREGQRRIYSHRDRVRLKLTLRGKRLGFTLCNIRELFDIYDSAKGEQAQIEQYLDLLAQRRAQLVQQREDIEAILGEINAFEGQCRKLLQDAERRAGQAGEPLAQQA
ncbi:MAG TPA: MerR family DNA-binding transcriptional regulator [Burkholderiales bacterium]|nr:MerR family DNA-binding transcriptional regulator [Burkholderiales bacterium]